MKKAQIIKRGITMASVDIELAIAMSDAKPEFRAALIMKANDLLAYLDWLGSHVGDYECSDDRAERGKDPSVLRGRDLFEDEVQIQDHGVFVRTEPEPEPRPRLRLVKTG